MPSESPRDLLMSAASGLEITADAAVAATDTPEQAEQIAALSEEIGQLKAQGRNATARSLARQHARGFPEPKPEPIVYPTDPGALAALILNRRGGA